MTYIILDLDNTIADDSWRIPRINWQHDDPFRRYHDYHQLSAFDKTGNEHLFKETENRIIIFTSRPVHYRSMTEEWLARKGINTDFLLMRNNSDHCKSVDLKEKMLNWLAEYGVDLKDIACAYDDRPDVVEMYLKRNIKADLVKIHDVCAYTKPNGELNE